MIGRTICIRHIATDIPVMVPVLLASRSEIRNCFGIIHVLMRNKLY